MYPPQAECGKGRCIAWDNTFAEWCEAPRYTHVTNADRYENIREFAWAFSPHNQSVVYWITPKSAHTRIMKRLLSRFRIQHVAVSEDSNERKRHFLDVALQTNPLEFTFVRDPISHTISAAQELQACVQRAYNVKVNALEVLVNVSNDTWQFRRCKELHIYPQLTGYGIDRRGINRLHFVGRTEHMRRDWSRFMALLYETPPVKIPVVNGRPRKHHPISFMSHPLVRAHTEWDTRCFFPNG